MLIIYGRIGMLSIPGRMYKDFMDLMKSYDGVCKRNYREYYKIEELKNT